jgi:hypothetical protein
MPGGMIMTSSTRYLAVVGTATVLLGGGALVAAVPASAVHTCAAGSMPVHHPAPSVPEPWEVEGPITAFDRDARTITANGMTFSVPQDLLVKTINLDQATGNLPFTDSVPYDAATGAGLDFTDPVLEAQRPILGGTTISQGDPVYTTTETGTCMSLVASSVFFELAENGLIGPLERVNLNGTPNDAGDDSYVISGSTVRISTDPRYPSDLLAMGGNQLSVADLAGHEGEIISVGGYYDRAAGIQYGTAVETSIIKPFNGDDTVTIEQAEFADGQIEVRGTVSTIPESAAAVYSSRLTVYPGQADYATKTCAATEPLGNATVTSGALRFKADGLDPTIDSVCVQSVEGGIDDWPRTGEPDNVTSPIDSGPQAEPLPAATHACPAGSSPVSFAAPALAQAWDVEGPIVAFSRRQRTITSNGMTFKIPKSVLVKTNNLDQPVGNLPFTDTDPATVDFTDPGLEEKRSLLGGTTISTGRVVYTDTTDGTCMRLVADSVFFEPAENAVIGTLVSVNPADPAGPSFNVNGTTVRMNPDPRYPSGLLARGGNQLEVADLAGHEGETLSVGGYFDKATGIQYGMAIETPLVKTFQGRDTVVIEQTLLSGGKLRVRGVVSALPASPTGEYAAQLRVYRGGANVIGTKCRQSTPMGRVIVDPLTGVYDFRADVAQVGNVCVASPGGGVDDAPVPGSGTGVAQGDLDSDGVTNAADNCPRKPNPGQRDTNGDGVGDLCAPDKVRPKALSVSPSAGQTGVLRVRNVSARFSEPVKGVKRTSFRLVNTRNGNAVAATVARVRKTNRYVLNPRHLLAARTTYRVRLIGGAAAIRDASNNRLPGTTWRFRTR